MRNHWIKITASLPTTSDTLSYSQLLAPPVEQYILPDIFASALTICVGGNFSSAAVHTSWLPRALEMMQENDIVLNYLFLQLFQRVVNVETCSKTNMLNLEAKVDAPKIKARQMKMLRKVRGQQKDRDKRQIVIRYHIIITMLAIIRSCFQKKLIWLIPFGLLFYLSFFGLPFYKMHKCKILTIRHHPQDQDLSAIQAIKWLAVLAAHLQLEGLAALLFLPLAHRRQAGGHELPAVCQTNGER